MATKVITYKKGIYSNIDNNLVKVEDAWKHSIANNEYKTELFKSIFTKMNYTIRVVPKVKVCEFLVCSGGKVFNFGNFEAHYKKFVDCGNYSVLTKDKNTLGVNLILIKKDFSVEV
jgi:hypothetical protein